MSLVSVLACAVLPQLQGVEGDEPRTVLWPFGSGYAQYALLTTYGQARPEAKGRILHAGLDVSGLSLVTGGRSRSVYALEDGVVEQVHVDQGQNYISGLVVSSKARPERAWLYLHLEKDSLRFDVGEEVRINQILGEVLLHDTVTGVEHVHLSRLGGDFRNQAWVELGALNVRNPLALFRPETLGDTTHPAVTSIDCEDFAFRADDGGTLAGAPYARAALPASSPASPLPIDVLAVVGDGDGGPYPLAPYRLELTIQDVPPKTFTLCLDGPLPDPAALCRREKRAAGVYDLFFVLTNGAEGCDAAPRLEHAWEATSGPHTLHLRIEDVARNQAAVTTVVEAH